MAVRGEAEQFERNYCFDGLRGVAALAVLLFHMAHLFHVPFFSGGYLAVDFFFLLSGLVIARAYSVRLSDGMSTAKFLEVRLIRIYPLYLVGIALGLSRAIGALLMNDPRAIAPVELVGYTVVNLLLLPVPVDLTSIFPLNAPAWSLSLELIVNLIFALTLFRLKAFSLVCLALVGAVLMIVGTLHAGNLNAGVTWEYYYVGAGRALWGFCIGMLLARLPTVRITGMTAIVLTILSLLLLAVSLTVSVPQTSRGAYDLVMALIGFPLLIWLVAGVRLDNRFGKACGAIGDLSYPLYATHYPLLLPLSIAAGTLGDVGQFGAIVAAVICIVLAAILAVMDNRVRGAIARRLHVYRSARLQVLSD